MWIKNNAEFLCGNFLKNGYFEKLEKYGRHLRAAGCDCDCDLFVSNLYTYVHLDKSI